MLEGLSRNQVIGWVAALAVIVVLGGRYLRQPDGSEPAAAHGSPPSVRIDRPSAGAAVVHVAGAVRRPGVYKMRAGARIDDAVRRAGGATAKADLSAVNLAAKVEDGRQVLVPLKAAAAAAIPAGEGGAAATPASAPINLNTATPEQLDTLDGVGPATVQKILDYRQEHGGFGRVDELAQVPGIGPKRLAALRDKVTV